LRNLCFESVAAPGDGLDDVPAVTQCVADIADALDERVVAHRRVGPDGFEQFLLG
jgi:hypothetical protein